MCRCAPESASRAFGCPPTTAPSTPEGAGTDDYRCFLVDPGFDTDQLVSGVQIAPENAAIVHHVIVSKVEPGGRPPRAGPSTPRTRERAGPASAAGGIVGRVRRRPRQG